MPKKRVRLRHGTEIEHLELIEPGGRKILHRNWAAGAKRPADIPLRATTHSHRHRPPLCCNMIITRPLTEADHVWDGISVLRTLDRESDD